MDRKWRSNLQDNRVLVPAGAVKLEGILRVPEGATGIVLFAPGRGGSSETPRYRFIAEMLHDATLATLLIDLLTPQEQIINQRTKLLRFDIDRLTARLLGATTWLLQNPTTQTLRIGYLGDGTGSAAALVAATLRPDAVGAIVSCSGRLDLTGSVLSRVQAPTLLMVGGDAAPLIAIHRKFSVRLQAKKQLVGMPGVSHLFEESSVLEEVARFSSQWFRHYLVPATSPNSPIQKNQEPTATLIERHL